MYHSCSYIYPFIHLSIHHSIHIHRYMYINTFIHPSIFLSKFIDTCTLIHSFIHPSFYMSSQSFHLIIYSSIIYSSVYAIMYIFLSIYLLSLSFYLINRYNGIKHLKVIQHEDKYGFSVPCNYSSLLELIIHYSENSLETHNPKLTTTLAYPLNS